VADELRKQPGVDVQVVDGARGEFTVLADGREVAKKTDAGMPSVEDVLAAVRNAGQATVGAKGG
jgi:hypothetical protein